MKHILVVNPAAGKTNALPRIKAEAEALSSLYDVMLYETKGRGDATAFVKRTIAENPDVPMRFYACGGDGTLKEVVNGAVGAPEHISVSCYPCGSGNDFVKYYGGVANFLSLAKLFEAEVRLIDLVTDGTEYSVNAANFGFDYEVCKTMERARRFPLLGGKRAYYVGIVRALFTGMRNRVKVVADGEALTDKDRFLLCTVANGTYIGGSYMCAPRSDNEDGYLELCYVKSVSVPRFLSLIGYYKRGEHLDTAAFSKYIIYRRVKRLEVSSVDKKFGYALDGELHPSTDFTLEIAPGALRFAVPKEAWEYVEAREKARKEHAKA